LATAIEFQDLRLNLLYFVSCLCTISSEFSEFFLDSGFFVGFIEPRATRDFSEPELSLQAVRIANHVWRFQVEHNTITLSDLYMVLVHLPLLPAPSFAMEVGSLFCYIASSASSGEAQWEFQFILDRLMEILSIIPTGEAIKRTSRTARKLIELSKCPPLDVLQHRFFGELMSQIRAPPVDRKPRNRVELVCLILDIARSICPEARLSLLQEISSELYIFLVTECSAETAAVGLTLATLRVAGEDSDVTEWCRLIPIVDETWHVSIFKAPYFVDQAWVIFCQGLLLRMGAGAVSIFLELDIIPTFTRYIDSDMEMQAYAIHLILEMIRATRDLGTLGPLVDAILVDHDAIENLETFAPDDQSHRETFCVPDLGLEVCPAHEAQLILTTLNPMSSATGFREN
jgi:hypothetical protein